MVKSDFVCSEWLAFLFLHQGHIVCVCWGTLEKGSLSQSSGPLPGKIMFFSNPFDKTHQLVIKNNLK